MAVLPNPFFVIYSYVIYNHWTVHYIFKCVTTIKVGLYWNEKVAREIIWQMQYSISCLLQQVKSFRLNMLLQLQIIYCNERQMDCNEFKRTILIHISHSRSDSWNMIFRDYYYYLKWYKMIQCTGQNINCFHLIVDTWHVFTQLEWLPSCMSWY